MTYVEPVLLDHEHLVDRFACGRPVLDDWLVRRALSNQRMGTSRTWVITEARSPRVVAFYASSTASILRAAQTKQIGAGQPDELPAILLGRMAVDLDHQGQGLGAELLRHFVLKAIDVAGSVGVRAVLVHAKDDRAQSFYLRYGFTESPIDPLTLLMLLPGERLRSDQ